MNLIYPLFKKPFIAIYFFALTITLISSCSKSGSNPTPQNTTPKLAITALSVSSGPYTTAVTITGTGFSGTLTGNQIFFNGVAATVTNFSTDGTSITTSVPLAAGTGNVTVKVNGVTATGPVFTYQQAEVVTTLKENFGNLNGIVLDGAGNIYVADESNFSVRKITPSGVESVLAGGISGSADGTGTAASFNGIDGITIDQNGNLYVVDAGNFLIRKITPAGVVTTLAGNRFSKSVDGAGTSASFSSPSGIVIDAYGNLYVTDVGTSLIRKITPAGIVSTLITTGYSFGVKGIAIDKPGNLYVSDQADNLIVKITPTGVASEIAHNSSPSIVAFDFPYGLAVDANGNIFVPNTFNGTIIQITPTGVTSNFAGLYENQGFTDGPLATATFGAPTYVTFDVAGNMYVSDNTRIRKISFQ